MKKYLLLRNNKQTGPYTMQELLEMGLKPQDLLWMEGKSASWRYPSEFEEFKSHPSIIHDEQPDRLFTDVQNLVFHLAQEDRIPVHNFPDDELIEFPTMARFMDSEKIHDLETGRDKITSTGILPVESGIPEELPEIKPIFKEPAPADIEEKFIEQPNKEVEKNELSETILSGNDEKVVIDIPTEPVIKAITEDQVSPEIETKPKISPTRVSVTLPTAVRDHTYVVIQPKNIDQVPPPIKEIQSDPIPVATSMSPIEKVPEDGITDRLIEEKIYNRLHEKPILHLDPVPVAEIPEMKIPASVIPEKDFPVQKKTVLVEDKLPVTEIPLNLNKAPEPEIVYVPIEQTASGNLMQKLAVAAGIISLIGVAGLIANSIFNPDAYNYQVKTNPAVIQPVISTSLTQNQGTNQTGQTEISIPENTNLQQPVSNSNVGSEGEIRQQKLNPKQVKSTEKTAVPANSGNEQHTVKANASNPSTEEKAPVSDPREETRKNISSLVNYELNNYKVNAFGGVSDFEVVINNNSAYPLDLVVVELKYIQSNKKIYKTERLEFKGVAPKGKQSIGVAKTNRGIKVETAITSISSRELDLTYNN